MKNYLLFMDGPGHNGFGFDHFYDAFDSFDAAKKSADEYLVDSTQGPHEGHTLAQIVSLKDEEVTYYTRKEIRTLTTPGPSYVWKKDVP